MPAKFVLYVIGSLKARDRVIEIAELLEQHATIEAFADWTAPGPDADDYLRDMAKARGLDWIETINSYAARHVASFDQTHLDRADAALLVLPCGKSCHLELGYMIGKGKPTYVYMPEPPERVDVMYNLGCNDGLNPKVFSNLQDIITDINRLTHEREEWYRNVFAK